MEVYYYHFDRGRPTRSHMTFIPAQDRMVSADNYKL